jgi:uncharacterized membrane protein YccF (DUF307 family)
MNLIGNIVWVLFGGFFIFLEYLITSILLMATIVGIPFGIQTLKLAMFALWPFGKKTIDNKNASGCLSLIMNIIWILIGGFWICVSHIAFGILFGITIIGIPFAKQHFKLASLALTPFGRDIIDKK